MSPSLSTGLWTAANEPQRLSPLWSRARIPARYDPELEVALCDSSSCGGTEDGSPVFVRSHRTPLCIERDPNDSVAASTASTQTSTLDFFGARSWTISAGSRRSVFQTSRVCRPTPSGEVVNYRNAEHNPSPPRATAFRSASTPAFSESRARRRRLCRRARDRNADLLAERSSRR